MKKLLSYRSVALSIVSIAALSSTAAACATTEEDDGGVSDSSELTATSCGASLERYPVAGQHNGGWDKNATTFSCGDRNNTDYYTAAGDANHRNGHLGNDIFGARGTPIVAAKSGVVTEVGYSAIGGNNVVVRDDCGWSFYYAHLDSIDRANAVVGRRVNAGTSIGTLGDTGSAKGTAPHLHFSAYPGSYYSGIDPFPILQAVVGTACGGAPTPEPEPIIEPRPEGGPFPALDVRYPLAAGTWITQCNESLDGERAWRVSAGGSERNARWAKAEYPQNIHASCGTADNELGIHPLILRNEPSGTLNTTWVAQCEGADHMAHVYRVAYEIDGHPAAPFHHNEVDATCP